jgi:hypothetical protein
MYTDTAAIAIAAMAIAAGAAVAGLERGRCGKIGWMLQRTHTDLS